MRPILALGLLLATGAAPAQTVVVDGFACNADRHLRVTNRRSPVLMYEVARTNEALDACTRPRASDGSENYLYTWGHRDKLAQMMSRQRLEYCAHDQARLLTSLGRAYDTVQAAQPARNEMLDAALEKVVRDYFVIPSPSWYPAMRGRLAAELETEYGEAMEQCGDDDRCTAHVEGRLAGLRQAESSSRPRLNTATFGVGVSFGNDPVAFASHLYDENHAGLVCRIGATNLAITDIVGTAAEKSLEALYIRIPANATNEATKTLRSLFPWYEPLAFENAAHGRILRVGSNNVVYLDKCAIEYRTSCRYIKVDTLESCSALSKIISRLDALVHEPESLSPSELGGARSLGAYLVDQGPYPDTAAVIQALTERFELRCPNG